MHQLSALLMLFILPYAVQSASLESSNTPRSNPINQGTPQIIQPANLIQPQNLTNSLLGGTSYDIGSNLTVYITLGEPVSPDDLDQLLKAAKDQVQDHANSFGPQTPVPLRKKKKNRDFTQTFYHDLEYIIEPGPAYVPRRPGLEWGEFQVVTFWLYEHLSSFLEHRACTFVLFRKEGVNLAFGKISTLEAKVSG